MAIRDDVDVGVLGVLRGAIRPASKHEVFAWTLVGTALGSLAIDAGMCDEHVLEACRGALECWWPSWWPTKTEHEELAFNLLGIALGALRDREDAALLALCDVALQQIRAAAGDPQAIGKLRELQAAIEPHAAKRG